MLNVLVISDGAAEIYELIKTEGFAPARGSALAKYDMALLDLDSASWQERLRELRLEMPVVGFSAPDIKKAVESMRLGACDYIEKPLTPETVGALIAKYKKDILTHRYGFEEIIGVSEPMREVFSLIRKAAGSQSNVLITGESGTGKELVARAIHRWSRRNEKDFTTINCSAIPDTLLESELFGFEKGSFTGANYTKKGLLDTASGGTVFLDEIGDVSALFQIKVLRVLQEGEIMRIGGAKHLKVDLRIIAATNADLGESCRKGTFREDLFYRLNVINIHLPPLRDKRDDIPLLARHFLEKHAPKRKDLHIKGISTEAMSALAGYHFPGNVRELENIVERSISFASSPSVMPADLPGYIMDSSQAAGKPVPKLREAIRNAERDAIVSALKLSDGNISRTASHLGIYRQQLQRKLKSLKIVK